MKHSSRIFIFLQQLSTDDQGLTTSKLVILVSKMQKKPGFSYPPLHNQEKEKKGRKTAVNDIE